tara:strand:- start:2025 stop:2561 length:537 start_codon:yes stop_codon:yes gene_type:complete
MVKNIYRLIKHKTMINTRETVTPGETPDEITLSMIDQDLKDGVSKPEMAIKYGIKPWEVDEMFKHPDLKGRRPARKRTLSFKFVDDTDTADATMSRVEEQDWIDAAAKEEVDPNQVTLEEAIDEAIESVEEVKETIDKVVEEIDEIFPTEITGIPNGDTMSDTDDYLEEEEIEKEFEL